MHNNMKTIYKGHLNIERIYRYPLNTLLMTFRYRFNILSRNRPHAIPDVEESTKYIWDLIILIRRPPDVKAIWLGMAMRGIRT